MFVGCPKLHVVKRQCNRASADQPSHNLVLSDVQNCGGGQPSEIVVKRFLFYVADEPFRRFLLIDVQNCSKMQFLIVVEHPDEPILLKRCKWPLLSDSCCRKTCCFKRCTRNSDHSQDYVAKLTTAKLKSGKMTSNSWPPNMTGTKWWRTFDQQPCTGTKWCGLTISNWPLTYLIYQT